MAEATTAESTTAAAATAMCVECEDVPAAVRCAECEGDALCGLCFKYLHRRGSRQHHTPHPLPGVDMAQHLEPVRGTTEHFAATHSSPPVVHSSDSPSCDSSTHADAAHVEEEEDSERGLARSVPVRLTPDERQLLGILEGVLEVSEYTDKVDVSSDPYGWRMGWGSFYGGGGGGGAKRSNVETEVAEILRSIAGLCCCAAAAPQQMIAGMAKDAMRGGREGARMFAKVFEVGRRFKVMNPDRMRNTYGKLMHMLMDVVQHKVSFERLIPIEVSQRGEGELGEEEDDKDKGEDEPILPILTVSRMLESRGALAVLDDPALRRATRTVVSSSSSEAARAMVADKAAAQKEMVARHCGESRRLTESELRLCLDSLSDAKAHLVANRGPVEQVISHLLQRFPAAEPGDKHLDLTITSGERTSKLSHRHHVQREFVRQSLTLWSEVQHHMHALWSCADSDLLGGGGSYRLCNTGQGLNRMQSAPAVSSAMSKILGAVQRRVEGGWVGLSVVHLGDQDVPNALFFIDKYSQVPRILGPLSRIIDRIGVLARDPRSAMLVQVLGGEDHCKTFILHDFFRFGFDGSGSDGGSCVDGRLTSCWNWCSLIEKKVFYALVLACGFEGFDGNWR